MNTQALTRATQRHLPPRRQDGAHRALTGKVLHQENLAFQGPGGISANNRHGGFLPAFLDTATGTVYLARYADGRLAPMHFLDGLPPELVIMRSTTGRVMAVKESVIAGFVRCGLFFTREQAAAAVGS